MSSRHVMTFNAGSSSIKFALFETDGTALSAIASGLVEMVGGQRHFETRDSAGATTHTASWTGEGGEPFHADALHRILDWRGDAYPAANVTAAGHRVVHGGIKYTAPVVVTDGVLEELNSLIPLAPLHEPHNIAAILAARSAWPDIPQVACFDTAFHRSHPFVNDVFGLPRSYFEEGVRRYGFHGLSYEYVSQRLRQIAPHHAAGRVVVAHLGNGASMCAMRDGQSVASSMAFTALDGLPMGTRCGQLDPGVLLYLMQEKRMDAEQIADLLYNRSGLKGMSGISHDMRELEASDRSEAREAIEYFVYRIRHELGGLAAALEGIDGIVFCGGIGEHAWRVRQRVLEGMEWIGVELDTAANRNGAQVISSERSRVRVFVIQTNEEVMIANHTLAATEQSKS